MYSAIARHKNISCDFNWGLNRKKPVGFNSDLNLFCVEAFKFLKTNNGRSLIKGRSTQQFCVALTICGQLKIKSINKKHRKKNKVTDVLSFPQFYDWNEVRHFQQVYLGDIVICFDICGKQARKHGISLREEFFHLLFHGFLHLLDYDHERSLKDEKLMFSLEQELVKKAMRHK
jgi:probable rRNA maturation factor